jgi:hypothetical protein
MSGTAVDIVTGLPLAVGVGGGRDAEVEANDLLSKMEMAGLPASQAARVVGERVLAVLEKRIERILQDDPQALVCLEILKAIEAPAVMAREAARRLVKRHNFFTPALGNETTPEKEKRYP